MDNYFHKVQYYETDKMGVVHHSNYIRFMEEARVDYFKKLGFDYLDFEKKGVYSPVIALDNIKFKKPSTVGDVIEVIVSVKSYNRLVLSMHYIMKLGEQVIFEGDSSHCFMNSDNKLIRLSDDCFGDFHRILLKLLNNN